MTAELVSGIAELTLEVRDRELRGPVEHAGGDRSVYFEDPEGNVVEVWDFFERGEGRREGTDALADEGAAADSSH